ncbi:MAG: CHC2 zinc finger domain-containing protein [Candidatus Pacearchaeota archaeon]|jgi:hypothetical protein
MDKEAYAGQFGRWVSNDEIVIEDLTEQQLFEVAEEMSSIGYCLEYWKCPKQINGHLHIKNIQFPEQFPLNEEQILKYKELVMKKHIPQSLWENVDWNFTKAKRHRIAEEGKEHFKGYGIKSLIKVWNEGKVNYCEKELFFKARGQSQEKHIRKNVVKGTGITSKIVEKVSIIELAKKYNFKVRGNKATCLFHADKDPSLSFNDEKGLWYCFGCCEGGNIIDFLAMCKKHNLKKRRD